MDHILDFIAHVLLGHAVRRVLFHSPAGVVVVLVVLAVVYLLLRSRRGVPRYRRSRR